VASAVPPRRRARADERSNGRTAARGPADLGLQRGSVGRDRPCATPASRPPHLDATAAASRDLPSIRTTHHRAFCRAPVPHSSPPATRARLAARRDAVRSRAADAGSPPTQQHHHRREAIAHGPNLAPRASPHRVAARQQQAVRGPPLFANVHAPRFVRASSPSSASTTRRRPTRRSSTNDLTPATAATTSARRTRSACVSSC
jgi:hypothetical protein